MGDARPYSGRRVFTNDARPYLGRRLLGETDAVPAVLTHSARDGRDYWTPGPWRPDGAVGNTTTHLCCLGWTWGCGEYTTGT